MLWIACYSRGAKGDCYSTLCCIMFQCHKRCGCFCGKNSRNCRTISQLHGCQLNYWKSPEKLNAMGIFYWGVWGVSALKPAVTTLGLVFLLLSHISPSLSYCLAIFSVSYSLPPSLSLLQLFCLSTSLTYLSFISLVSSWILGNKLHHFIISEGPLIVLPRMFGFTFCSWYFS